MTVRAPAPTDFEPIVLDVSHLVTEDDTPVDNPFSEKQMRLLTEPLYSNWKPGAPFVAMANVGLYFALNSPVLVPDTLVSLNVETPDGLLPKEHRAYFHWIYGKSPDIVVEIVSNRVGGERKHKMKSYAHHGVPYYVVYDPEGHIQKPALQCFALDLRGTKASPAYQPLEKAFFPTVGLGLTEWAGEYEGKSETWIRWVNAKGKLILTGAEHTAKQYRRAERERNRADAEQGRANAEQNRADALAAKLRELGIDPASIAPKQR